MLKILSYTYISLLLPHPTTGEFDHAQSGRLLSSTRIVVASFLRCALMPCPSFYERHPHLPSMSVDVAFLRLTAAFSFRQDTNLPLRGEQPDLTGDLAVLG
jgi:hypothetical protein